MTDLKRWMFKRKNIQFKSQINSKSILPQNNQTIAFLVDGRIDKNLKIIRNYMVRLEKKGIHTSLLFMTDHSQPEQISFQAFNKKSFNWYHFPKTKEVLNFIEYPFDKLICFNMEEVHEIDTILQLSQAKFKIGIQNKSSEEFDLIIQPRKEKNWEDYLMTLEKTMIQLSLSPVLV